MFSDRAFTAGFEVGDELLFTDQNGITGSYDPSTGNLTLTGSATLAFYNAAIQSVQFSNSSDDPSTTQRTVQFTVSDGEFSSAPVVDTINITAVNDAPTVLGLTTTPVSAVFDGTDDVIDVGRGMADSFAINGDLTVETWVKFDSITPRQSLINFVGTPGSELAADNVQYNLELKAATGQIEYLHEYGAGLNVVIVFDANMTAGDWAHLSLVRDGTAGEVHLYKDGVEVPAVAAAINGVQQTSPFNTYNPGTEGPTGGENGTLALGALSTTAPANFLEGEVADVRIWAEARTATEVADNFDQTLTLPATEANLVGYWDFADAAGEKQSVEDLSGNGNDIRVFDSLTFDGVDDVVTTSGTSTLGTHSATVWVNTTSTTTGTLMSGTNSSDQSFDLSINASGELVVDIQGVASHKLYSTTAGYNLIPRG